MIIHDIEQNSKEWLELRAGMPTSSNASRLITPTGKAAKLDSYAVTMANEKFLGKAISSFSGNKHTERGHALEAVASSMYSALYDIDTNVIGFCTDDNARYGASPDRYLYNAGVEIKCLDLQAHTEALVYYHKNRKAPPDRIAQCQFQLLVTGWEYIDLFYYSKELPELRIRILPIKSFFEMLECQIDEVIEERDKIVKILEASC